MGEKIIVVTPATPMVGDMATHKYKDRPQREVAQVSGQKIRLNVGGFATGFVEASNYTYTRLVHVPATLNPVELVCPNCNAQPGEPCTQPTDVDRKAVTWTHLSRMHEVKP